MGVALPHRQWRGEAFGFFASESSVDEWVPTCASLVAMANLGQSVSDSSDNRHRWVLLLLLVGVASSGIDGDEFWFLRGGSGDAISSCLVRPAALGWGRWCRLCGIRHSRFLLSRRCVLRCRCRVCEFLFRSLVFAWIFSKRRLSRVELQWDCDVHVVYGVILVISRRTRSSIMSVVVGMCCI
jgi:hypothetical protein